LAADLGTNQTIYYVSSLIFFKLFSFYRVLTYNICFLYLLSDQDINLLIFGVNEH